MQNNDRQRAIEKLNAIPRLRYGHFPTPVEELPRFRAALGDGAPRIFIKRDDYSGPGFGGNKVRKLEYLLARAQADGADVAITCGGVKSNHARVTAAMCARLGLRCVLVLNQAAVMYDGLAPASLAADQWYGAEIHRVSDRQARIAAMAELTGKLRGQGLHLAEIPLGGSVPLGALGFVRAIGEAKGQFEAMNIGLRAIFHSSSSGGTQAGIVAGCRLFDWHGVQDFGVSPDDPAASIGGEVARILQGLEEILGVPLRQDVTVLDQFTGAGYGIPTAEGDEATEILARTEGIVLDPVYTAKAMAALIERVRAGEFSRDDNVLFWHTGGQLAHFYLPEAGQPATAAKEKK